MISPAMSAALGDWLDHQRALKGAAENTVTEEAPPAVSEIVDIEDERKLKSPPGPKTIIKEKYDELFNDLTNDMLLKGIEETTKGEIKAKYDAWVHEVFCGRIDKVTNVFIKGIMNGFKLWVVDNPGYKFKDNIILPGLRARAARYKEKTDKGDKPSPLEERCHLILKKMKKAEKAADEKRMEVKSQKHKRQRELTQEEKMIGLLPNGKKRCTSTLLAALLRDGNVDEKNSASILSAYCNLAGKTTYPLPGKLLQNCCSTVKPY